MTEPVPAQPFPRSPKDEIEGMVYFRRLCDKARLFAAGNLHEDYHANLGKAMDQWACDFLGVSYQELITQLHHGASDEEALQWCYTNGNEPSLTQRDWWNSYMRNRGFRDDLSERLIMRKTEAGFEDCDDVVTFFDFIDKEEGR